MGSKSTLKRGLETKNKVENNKNKIIGTYKNENQPPHMFFFHSFFLLFVCTNVFLFELLFLYSHFFLFFYCFHFFLFLFFFFLYSSIFFPFQQVTRKWNDENGGTFIKQSTNPLHLFETHYQNNSKAPFCPKV